LFFAAGAALAFLAWFAGPHWSALKSAFGLRARTHPPVVAGFAFVFGRPALQSAKFPLVFLLLTHSDSRFPLDKAFISCKKVCGNCRNTL